MSKVILEINFHKFQSAMETFRREALQNECSLKVRKIQKKATVPESFSS